MGQSFKGSAAFHAWLNCGASVLALCGLAAANPAMAQQTPPATTPRPGTAGADETVPTADPAEGADSIVVTGIRQSLRSAQEIKRQADVVVDSISAEDIGALPDRSVTEALQRVPGVAINRFAGGHDPDHLSAARNGVVVRCLPSVRSELNGRNTFTANNGRGLSFADVPAELMGGVDVFKSPSADMIEGGIAGTVNLRTRVPFDSQGFVVSGSVEGSWGDFAREWSPTVSLFASNRWDTNIGEFGILGNFVYSQLKSRADGLQISNYGERTLYSNGDVIPAAGATAVRDVYLPRGAAMRSQEFNRERYGYGAAAQWRSPNRDVLATLQFLRSDSRQAWTENAIEIATDVVTDQGDSRAVPGTRLEFGDSGLFERGVITGPTGWRDDQQTAWGGNPQLRTPVFGLQSNNQRRSVDQRFVTTDYGANIKWDANERLTFNFDYQHVDSKVDNLDMGIWTSSFQNVFFDMSAGRIPTIEFRPPEVCVGPAQNSPCNDLGAAGIPPTYFGPGHTSFEDPYNSFFRAAMDHIEQSEGKQNAFRIDGDYSFPEESWLTSIRMGYRIAERNNVARFSQYNWGVLSEIWGAGGPVWLDEPIDGSPDTAGGAPGSAQAELVPFDNFLRGKAPNPLLGQSRWFYSGSPAQNYQEASDFALRVGDEWRARLGADGCPQNWVPLALRCGVTEGPFQPGEINPVKETNNATYMMVRFGNSLANGVRLSGNFGVRWTGTTRLASGLQVFQQQTFQSDAQCAIRQNPETGEEITPTPFCRLPADVRQQARQWASGASIPSQARLNYDYFLPSLNLKAELGGGVQLRFAWYNGIAAPEFGLTRNFYNLALSTDEESIRSGGGRPIARATVGNPFLRPIESSNFDASVEWYFADVGQLTFAAFYKKLTGVLTNGTERRPFTNNGATFDAIVTTPVNAEESGKVRGFEIAYQQTFTFLPGPLRGLGLNATYTYVDSSGVPQSTLSETDPDVAAGTVSRVDTGLLPLQGLSKHSINFTPFFEQGPLSIRAAYSWRSRFLLTVRDVIVPFAPVYNEASGQLDASIFYSITPQIRVGVQGVNLLNEVTRTSQVIDASEQSGIFRGPRSWFINDRRFTAIIRATF
ncbi:MAG: TonB-dependent receptor [Allosphingosinicella sp.]|uniref:TonB-dependent receptor n=1 Tax=Allosphingosinicella sp. TaxID=2823234 RepID=UPI0039541B86